MRTLALAMLGKTDEAEGLLRSVASNPLSSADAESVRWLAGFLEHERRAAEAGRPAVAAP